MDGIALEHEKEKTDSHQGPKRQTDLHRCGCGTEVSTLRKGVVHVAARSPKALTPPCW